MASTDEIEFVNSNQNTAFNTFSSVKEMSIERRIHIPPPQRVIVNIYIKKYTCGYIYLVFLAADRSATTLRYRSNL